MNKICLFPGTFDPVTLGHVDVIDRSLSLFDKIVVGIGNNVGKTPMFTAQQRLDWIKTIYANEDRVEALIYDGLTIECCHQVNAQYILRGIRYVFDFEYEKVIADMNRALEPTIETIFLTCSPVYTSFASTLVRDVITNGGSVENFVPAVVYQDLLKRR